MAKKRFQKKQKTNKYDNLSKPQAEFDFHDRGILTKPEIKKLTDEFLEECRERGLTKILFITGKGLHSKHGMPVIKPFLKKYLSSLPYVFRVYEGRFDRGGSGTLEVILDSE
ncbi:MAG: Smr/MutS family protein [Candidatus Gracilibacteria bacterium]|nr:Smr/MutS family protein [Candidatus Peregrinibacteria bacterium]